VPFSVSHASAIGSEAADRYGWRSPLCWRATVAGILDEIEALLFSRW